ncbi:MAG: SRPBCC family protein [Chthoniobacterales bacterium]
MSRQNSFEVITDICAQLEQVFDLARSIDLHLESAVHTGERAVAGKITGLIDDGETVMWRAKHFGIWFYLTSKIVKYDRPHFFQDVMTEGPFSEFSHEHYFKHESGITTMRDAILFKVPFGVLGDIVAPMILTHLYRFVSQRNLYLKQAAESDDLGQSCLLA